MCESKTMRVIGAIDLDDDWMYFSDYDTENLSVTYDLNHAADLSNDDQEICIQCFRRCIDEHPEVEWKILDVVTTVSEVFTDDVSITEYRQKSGLAKLNQREIKALGLDMIQVYIKTKFHESN